MVGTKGSIPRSFIESLLSRADIVQVITQRVPLKKAGTNFKACCPFHEEKTPSFNVSQTKQFYHCFGCGASGDALKFLMDYDGLTFIEAIESLAAIYGMEVPREQQSPQQQKQQKIQQKQQRNLYDIMYMVAKFYRHQLRDHPEAEQAKHYLRQRGVSAQVAKAFAIGFAPPGWDLLLTGLKKQFTQDDKLPKQLIEAGLLVEKPETGRCYDRFRHRIMFPIRDGRGRVIAFGGRVLGDEQPKYLNSPETPIFHKTNTLYGLFEMRQSRQKFDHVLVVEGYMDVVALAQFDIHNAVATLGTATTTEHLELLFRQVNDIVFCFDGDAAGIKAAWKALELALPKMEKDRSVRFLFLEQGQDPDSTIRQEGVAGFKQRVVSSLSLSDFLLQGLQGKLGFPVTTIEGRQQLVAMAEPYIQMAQGLYQYLLVEGLSALVELPAWRLEKQLNVRSGFASFKKTSPQHTKNKALATHKIVMSLPLKTLHLLMRNPSWVEVFSEAFLADLEKIQNHDYKLLSRYAVVLTKQHLDTNQAWQSLSNAGYQNELEAVAKAMVPEDEALEFESCVLKLAQELDRNKIDESLGLLS